MTPVEATQLIAATVEAGWSTTPVTFDGQRFTATTGEAWIRLAIRELPPLTTTHGAVGQRLTRQRGRVIAQVFAPIGTVDSALPALELALAFRDLFHGRSLGADPIHFEAAAPTRIGAEGGWYQVNVTIPFAYDERH